MDETQKTKISAFFSPTMILLGNNAVDRIGLEAISLVRISCSSILQGSRGEVTSPLHGRGRMSK